MSIRRHFGRSAAHKAAAMKAEDVCAMAQVMRSAAQRKAMQQEAAKRLNKKKRSR